MSEAASGEGATATDTSQEPKKTTRNTNGLKPCDRCRAQHLKCVYTSDKCQRCERSGHECIRTRKGIQFRRTSASNFDSRISHNRRAPRSATINRPLKFTDVTPNLTADRNEKPKTLMLDAPIPEDETITEADQQDSAQQTRNGNGSEAESQSFPGSANFTFEVQNEPKAATIDEAQGTSVANRVGEIPFASPVSVHPSLPTPPSVSARMFSSDHLSMTSSHATTTHRRLPRTSTNHFLDGLVKIPSVGKADSSELYVETVLLRYFHDELAPWFDLCDPDCHFATVIPQRAREPGPLRNALLTIATRHLARNKRFRSPSGTVQWNGRLLPQVTEEFAVPYHNECIRDLLQLSMRPKDLHDETLLAAVITLRFDEEMGMHSQEDEDDQQLFLRIASVIIEAQLPQAIMLPRSSPQVFLSGMDEDTLNSQLGIVYHTSPAAQSSITETEPDLGASGLRQACFWTAFRQELHAAFLKKQSVRFPLARLDAFRQLTPAIDAVWANRMVTFCADVLEFCYGSESSDGIIPPAYTNQERWKELRNHEHILCALLPATFEPTYCSEPNAALGTVFPEIWYLEPCHVTGTTYIELARMLLEVFNPTRPQLGHGFIAATNAFISSNKRILFRLCGIALSNSHCAPCLINACIGISIFGEYFGDPDEQDALLEILTIVSNRYMYPSRHITNLLKKAWNRDDIVDKVYSPTSVSQVETW